MKDKKEKKVVSHLDEETYAGVLFQQEDASLSRMLLSSYRKCRYCKYRPHFGYEVKRKGGILRCLFRRKKLRD